MGLDVVHELSACGQRETEERMHEIKLHVFQCVWVWAFRDCYLSVCACSTLPTLQVAQSMKHTCENIQSHQRNDMRQQSLYIPSTEQMERDIRWIELNERGTMSSGGRGREKNGENNIWHGFVAALMVLRWRINLLIKVTFALNVMSSVYFKHIRSSLNLSSILQRTSIVLWSNGIMRNRTTYGEWWSPPLLGSVILPQCLLFCLIIRWPACVAVFCHTQVILL